VNKFIVTFLLSVLISYFSVSYYLNPSVLASTDSPFEARVIQQINRQAEIRLSRQTFDNLEFKKRRDANLYLTLYNEYAVRSRENAIRATAAYEGIKPADVENAIFRGEIPTSSSDDQVQLTDKLESIRTSYNFERAMFRDLTYLQMNTLAFEMFANGSRSDSGFDLLKDLDDIEKLLFAERTPSQFDGSINLDRSTAKSITSQGFATTPPQQPISTQPEDPSAEDNDEDPDQTGTQPGTPDEDLPSSNLACPIDSSLQNAFQNFEDTQLALFDGELNPSLDATNQSSAISSFSQKAGFSRPNLKAFQPTPPRCNAGGVFTDYLVFCLRTEIVRAKARSYFPEQEDCVACEIQKIAKIIDDIHSDSLVPQKITGNIGEPAVCKNYALSVLTMNISLIPAPARSDLEIVPLVQEMTTANVRETIVTPRDPISTEESILLTVQSAQSGVVTAIADAQATADEITESDDLSRKIAISQSSRIESNSVFVNQLSQRLNGFSQNFSLMLDNISQINESLIRINQKGVCQ